jgi:hypothetical protein
VALAPNDDLDGDQNEFNDNGQRHNAATRLFDRQPEESNLVNGGRGGSQHQKAEKIPGSSGSSYRAAAGLTFAYGRALDQALVRLIQGRRISAFSMVPSVMVQTKDGPSDIMPGSNGSSWRDFLNQSALARMLTSQSGD